MSPPPVSFYRCQLFENYYPQKWWVAKLPKYATQAFSYRYVIRPAANYKRTFAFHTFRVILAHLKRAYKYWFYRCKELVCSDLWLPTPADNNKTVIHRAVMHCFYCVPTQVLLHRNKKPIIVKPCNQYHICPFCASRAAEDLYRRFIRSINKLHETDVNAFVSYRCERYVVRAKFDEMGWSAAEFNQHIKILAQHLRKERARYQQIAKELRTQTLGSLWAVVPYPIDAGWAIEIRQFYITHAKSRRPANRKRNSSTLFLQSVNIREVKQAIKLLGEFVTYPSTLLTAHVELTAAVLHARRGLRLLNGTGQLYRQGREKAAAEEIRQAPHIP